MKKTAHNYGLGRGCNYDLKRWRAHGGGGASNSEARRKVLRSLMVGGAGGESCRRSRKFFLREHEVGVGRLC
jgi:hypothetical protein